MFSENIIIILSPDSSPESRFQILPSWKIQNLSCKTHLWKYWLWLSLDDSNRSPARWQQAKNTMKIYSVLECQSLKLKMKLFYPQWILLLKEFFFIWQKTWFWEKKTLTYFSMYIHVIWINTFILLDNLHK